MLPFVAQRAALLRAPLSIVAAANSAGVKIDTVNIMVMDYYDGT
jgi:hypothetical protein